MRFYLGAKVGAGIGFGAESMRGNILVCTTAAWRDEIRTFVQTARTDDAATKRLRVKDFRMLAVMGRHPPNRDQRSGA
jgi:hypothetical protein